MKNKTLSSWENDRKNFIKMGWQNELTITAKIVYFIVICDKEIMQKIKPNESFLTDCKNISHLSGININSVKRALFQLEAFSLIKLKIGKVGKWNTAPIKITRNSPLPNVPDKETIQNIKNKLKPAKKADIV